MHSVRNLFKYLVIVLALVLLSTSNSWAQSTPQTPCVSSFLAGLIGEWVGTCEQSADGNKPDITYFHATVKKLDNGSYEGKFQFFKQGEQGLTACGETSVVTSLDSNGSAVSKIKGSGKVLVGGKLNDQRHELTETLCYSDCGSVQSKGSGTISVSGLPLGLGKNGKVKESQSIWSMKDGMLSIDQKMTVSFKVLVISKTINVQSHYTARRGSDVNALLDTRQQTPQTVPSGTGAGSAPSN